jgi:aspartate dehydrogenase
MLKVGVIGCGTIGSEICRAMDRGLVGAELVGISDIDRSRADDLARSLRKGVRVMDRPEVIKVSEMVVEATSKTAAPSIIREVLGCSKDVLVMSVGGLLEGTDGLLDLAKSKGKHIYVPSGAIAGLDAVKGAIVGSVSKVTLTTRKPPAGLKGTPYIVEHEIDLENLQEPTVIFSGPAAQAVLGFPANVNVAAALSLAGIGPEKTIVHIIADPGCDRNTHEIEVEGEFGRLLARTENIPAPFNPKTSQLAALSAIGLLQRITSSLVVGT